MYATTFINESPLKVFTAAESLTGGAFTAVELGEFGIAGASAGAVPVGIIGDVDFPIEAGEDVTVQISGGGLWTAGEDVKAGDFLSAGEGGKAVKSTAGKYIFAQALQNGATSSAVEVQIIRGGFAQ